MPYLSLCSFAYLSTADHCRLGKVGKRCPYNLSFKKLSQLRWSARVQRLHADVHHFLRWPSRVGSDTVVSEKTRPGAGE